MEFIDLQDSFYNLRAEHCERIKAIVNTHKAVAFFTDLVQTNDDVKNLLDYLAGSDSNTMVYHGRSPQERQRAVTAFNMQCEQTIQRGHETLPRLLLSLHSAFGFKLHPQCAIVILYRTADLGRYGALIEQAKGRHGFTGTDSPLKPSVYEIAYGESHA